MGTDTRDPSIPETHELVRPEDIEETLDVFAKGNDVIQPLADNQLEWLRVALETRRSLCGAEFDAQGHVNREAREQREAWDREIDRLDPAILRVQHFLSRLRALIPALMKTRHQHHAAETSLDDSRKKISQMMLDCSMAEAQSAIKGLAELRIHPRILNEFK